MINSIPMKLCCFCGKGRTNETQSVYGVGHFQCFKKSRASAPMDQFYHSHPNDKVKGIRVLYHVLNGRCTYIRYLPDQT